MDEDLSLLQEKLDQVHDQLAARERSRHYLDECLAQLEDQRRLSHELYAILRKEEADVNKLQSMSVRAVFHYFLKNKEEQLEIEHQEYVLAALRYNECVDSIALLEYEVAVLERLISQQPELEQRQKELLVKKELAVRDAYPEVATSLNNLDYKIARRRMELKEIDEALKAGTRAKAKLLEVNKLIERVEGWGQWGYMSDYSKSSFVDRARKIAVETNHALMRFESELKDVYKNLDVSDDLTLDAFDHFLSIFYDNMITDWIVQSNLRHTQNSLNATSAKAERLLESLKHEKRRSSRAIEDFKMQKRNLITTHS